MNKTLHPYQDLSLKQLNLLYNGKANNALLHMPMGTGKTEVAIKFFKQHKQGLFVVRRKNLTRQTYKRFYQAFNRPNIGLIQANMTNLLSGGADHYICSIDTLIRRKSLCEILIKMSKYVFIDEAHDATSPSYKKFLSQCNNLFVVGMTATPYKINGRYHEFWNPHNVIAPISPKEAVDKGYLCPLKFFCPSYNKLDESLLKKSMGDYTLQSLFKMMDKKSIYGDFEKYFIKEGLNKNTITFCVNIEHSKKIEEVLKQAGAKNIFRVDHNLKDQEQNEIKAKINLFQKKNEKYHIVNVNMFSTGIDIPSLEVGFMLRKTMSVVLWDQQVGRLTRNYPGKKEARVFDFTMNTLIHGTAFSKDRKPDIEGRSEPETDKPEHKVCPKCFSVVGYLLKVCPNCGLTFHRVARELKLDEDKKIELIDYDELIKRQEKKAITFDLSAFDSLI